MLGVNDACFAEPTTWDLLQRLQSFMNCAWKAALGTATDRRQRLLDLATRTKPHKSHTRGSSSVAPDAALNL